MAERGIVVEVVVAEAGGAEKRGKCGGCGWRLICVPMYRGDLAGLGRLTLP